MSNECETSIQNPHPLLVLLNTALDVTDVERPPDETLIEDDKTVMRWICRVRVVCISGVYSCTSWTHTSRRLITSDLAEARAWLAAALRGDG